MSITRVMGLGRRVGWWVLAAVAAGLLAVYAAVPGSTDVIYQVVGLGSATAILVAVRKGWATPRLPWLLVACSVFLSWLGDTIWTLYPLVTGHEAPFPSLADLSYLAAYPVLLVAAFRLRGRGAAGATGFLDSLIVAVPLTAVVWELAIMPTIETQAEASGLEVLVSVAYPVFDLFLIATVARLLMVPGQLTKAAWLLSGAVGIQLGADLVYAEQSLAGTYETGGILDVGWLTAYSLLALAALHPSAGERPASSLDDQLPTTRRMLILDLALFFAPAALLWREPFGHGIVALAWPAVTMLVMLRMQGLARSLGVLATSDSLTGLPNRASMTRLLERTTGDGAAGAVLFCDLDGFKLVNDGLGHRTGDRLLAAVGERLRDGVRHEDTVGRVGGDEFVVVCPGVTTVEHAQEVAERIRALLVAPFRFGDVGDLAVDVSIGGVVVDVVVDAAALLEQADAAMYRAKRTRQPEIERASRSADTSSLERLRTITALRRDDFCSQLRLQYQPEFFVASEAMFGFEALVRWQHPERGLLGPGAFIEVAESSGDINRIGRWVLGEACQQIAAWSLDRDSLPVAVNVSGRQLGDVTFPSQVTAALEEARIPPELLVIEITETAVVADIELAVCALTSLKDLGVTIAIDDFGTGHSSLSQLRRLPVDFLKIDRSFISSVDEVARDRALVAAIVNMSKALDIRTVAEGVERRGQLDVLVEIGCELAQGFLLGRPQDAEAASRLLLPSEVPQAS